MQETEFNFLKKGRVWWEAELKNGHKCKVKINKFSQGLEVGTHTLIVDDISVRTKYGTDLKFDPIGEQRDEAITFQHPFYNADLVAECRHLAGQWDAKQKAWIFPACVADKVEELEEKYNTELCTFEIEAKCDLETHRSPVTFCGYAVAEARGRDTGARIPAHIVFICGRKNSGGSSKNWYTIVKEGSTFRITCSKNLLEDYPGEVRDWHIKILKEDVSFSEIGNQTRERAIKKDFVYEAQLWEECENCGEEPIYLPQGLCEDCIKEGARPYSEVYIPSDEPTF